MGLLLRYSTTINMYLKKISGTFHKSSGGLTLVVGSYSGSQLKFLKYMCEITFQIGQELYGEEIHRMVTLSLEACAHPVPDSIGTNWHDECDNEFH